MVKNGKKNLKKDSLKKIKRVFDFAWCDTHCTQVCVATTTSQTNQINYWRGCFPAGPLCTVKMPDVMKR